MKIDQCTYIKCFTDYGFFYLYDYQPIKDIVVIPALFELFHRIPYARPKTRPSTKAIDMPTTIHRRYPSSISAKYSMSNVVTFEMVVVDVKVKSVVVVVVDDDDDVGM